MTAACQALPSLGEEVPCAGSA